jgi:hypothetical protein
VVALISGVLLTALLLGLAWALALVVVRLLLGSARFGVVPPRLLGRAGRALAGVLAAQRARRTGPQRHGARLLANGRRPPRSVGAAPEGIGHGAPRRRKDRAAGNRAGRGRLRRGLAIPARIAPVGRSRRGAAARASASAKSSDRLAA